MIWYWILCLKSNKMYIVSKSLQKFLGIMTNWLPDYLSNL